MGKSQQIRIVDIAEMAGVSAGTVDRILHDRGHVSQRNREKVEEVLRKIDYKPNIYASALAFKRRDYNFAYLLPLHIEGDYWDMVEKGILRAGEEFSSVNVNAHPFYYDQFDSASFCAAFAKALKSDPMGIIFAPVFRKESLDFIAQMESREIAYCFFDSKIDKVNEVAYFGQDSFASGVLACRVLSYNLQEGDTVALFVSARPEDSYSNQTALRRNGVMSYIEKHKLNYTINELKVRVQYPTEAGADIESFFTKHPDTKGVIALNSRVYMLCDYLSKSKLQGIPVVGFDPLSPNIDHLRNGYITALIGKRPNMQGYRCVKALCDALILKKSIQRNNFMPLDILLAENIDYYCDFDY